MGKKILSKINKDKLDPLLKDLFKSSVLSFSVAFNIQAGAIVKPITANVTLLERLETPEPEPERKKRKREVEDTEIEDEYLRRVYGLEKKPKEYGSKVGQSYLDDTKVHSTLENGNLKSKDKKHTEKGIDVRKANRTIFIGNLPVSVITDKAEYKALKTLFSQFGRIQSIRFRSIAFSELLPRKVAFLKNKLHKDRSNINGYIVFSEESSVSKAQSLNGTVFRQHYLRVDSVSHPAAQDTKTCIFIGNVAFTEQENSLWEHFKAAGEIESVRIVRDPETNIGKGFAYVQFTDKESVEKALLLHGKDLNGRKLRITRAKSFKKLNLNNKVIRAKKGKVSSQLLEGVRAKPTDRVSISKRKKKK